MAIVQIHRDTQIICDNRGRTLIVELVLTALDQTYNFNPSIRRQTPHKLNQQCYMK